MRFRATVWHQSSTSIAVEGENGGTRLIIEEDASSARQFEAKIRDRWIYDVDAQVDFGPISVVSQ